MAMFLELFPIALFFVSLFGLITSNNIIKTIVYAGILNAAVITFWIALGSHGGVNVIPPLMKVAGDVSQNPIIHMADPVPQSLMITAVVIGFSVTAVNIILLITLYRKYKTTDWRVLYKAVHDEAAAAYAKKAGYPVEETPVAEAADVADEKEEKGDEI